MKFTRLGGALLAAVLSFAVAGVAEASAETSNETSLTLTVTATNGSSTSVQLTCQPAGGTHPQANRACTELRSARGRFDYLAGTNGTTVCTMEYMPTTAAAVGTWRGRAVSWEREYSNRCSLRSATGSVFQF